MRAIGHQDSPVGVCIDLLHPALAGVHVDAARQARVEADRTARMMSTPLKFSGPFSSKIGVFCTASS